MKSGVLPLGAVTAGISTVTVLQRTGHVSAATLAPSLQSFWSGRVWLVASSVLVADRPAAPSIAGFVVVGLAVLALTGPRVMWVSAALGHVGSAVAVYGVIALVRAIDPHAFANVLSVVDFGTSAVIAAWLGAIAYRLWALDPRLSIGLLVGATLIGWLLRTDLTVLDTEHLVAVAVGVAVARYSSSVFRTRWKPAAIRTPLSTRRHIQPWPLSGSASSSGVPTEAKMRPSRKSQSSISS
jgi:hypothetical protein